MAGPILAGLFGTIHRMQKFNGLLNTLQRKVYALYGSVDSLEHCFGH